jgi:hypothetical protein
MYCPKIYKNIIIMLLIINTTNTNVWGAENPRFSSIKWKKGGVIIDDRLTGIIYIIVAVLIVVVRIAVPNFFDYLVMIIAAILLVLGIYLLLFKRR